MNSGAGDGQAERRAADLADQARQTADDLAAETRRRAESLAEVAGERAAELASSLDATLTGIMTRLEALGSALALVTTQLKAVADAQVVDRASQRRTRHLAVGLIVSFILDVSLTVAVTLLSVTALNQGSALHSSQLAACSVGNQSKVEQEQLWGFLFQLIGGAKTPQQKQFLLFVNKTFAPVNCAQLYK